MTLTDRAAFDLMRKQLDAKAAPNLEALAYYDGTHDMTAKCFSIPARMRDIKVAVGWGGTVVDVLEERLRWLGWAGPHAERLERVRAANWLDSEAPRIHRDALIFGCAFISVSRGEAGEPDPVVLGHSPLEATGLWNPRTRRLDAALINTRRDDDGAVSAWTMHLPDRTVWVEARDGDLAEARADRHNMGVVPVVMMSNRPRCSRQYGRSEITKAVRYYTDAATRTLLGMEVSREFYNTPQRVGLNMPERAFTDASGNPVNPWTAQMGMFWSLPPNPDGKEAPQPSVQQFAASSPAPYIDQIGEYKSLVAAEAGIPESYFGRHTANPSSADAIRALEARLVDRAESRQTDFGRAWLDVADLALRVLDGGHRPAGADATTCRWAPATTPTIAEQADAALKMAKAVPWLKETALMLELLGLTEEQIREAEAQRGPADTLSLADLLLGA